MYEDTIRKYEPKSESDVILFKKLKHMLNHKDYYIISQVVKQIWHEYLQDKGLEKSPKKIAEEEAREQRLRKKTQKRKEEEQLKLRQQENIDILKKKIYEELTEIIKNNNIEQIKSLYTVITDRKMEGYLYVTKYSEEIKNYPEDVKHSLYKYVADVIDGLNFNKFKQDLESEKYIKYCNSDSPKLFFKCSKCNKHRAFTNVCENVIKCSECNSLFDKTNEKIKNVCEDNPNDMFDYDSKKFYTTDYAGNKYLETDSQFNFGYKRSSNKSRKNKKRSAKRTTKKSTKRSTKRSAKILKKRSCK